MEWGDYNGVNFRGVEFEADYAAMEDASDTGQWKWRCWSVALIAELFDVRIERA